MAKGFWTRLGSVSAALGVVTLTLGTSMIATASTAAAACSGAWTVQPSPNLSATSNTLNGVAAIAPSNVWAVGFYVPSSGPFKTLIEHWNGNAWKVVASPNAGSPGNSREGNVLNNVVAVSANDVWAVGWGDNATNGYKTLIEHWNGTAWSQVPSPNPAFDSRLFGVRASRPTTSGRWG